MAIQIVIPKLQHKPPPQKRLHLSAAKLAMQPLRQQQRDIPQRNAYLADILHNNLNGDLPKIPPSASENTPPDASSNAITTLDLPFTSPTQRLMRDRLSEYRAYAASDGPAAMAKAVCRR